MKKRFISLFTSPTAFLQRASPIHRVKAREQMNIPTRDTLEPGVQAPRGAGPVLVITAIVVGLIGLYLTIGGAWLVSLGGSAYYVITGVAMLITAFLLLRARRAALSLYALILLGSMAWAIWEVGFEFWALTPRGDILFILGIWLLLPFVTRRLAPAGRGGTIALGTIALGTIALGGALAIAVVVIAISLTRDAAAIGGTVSNTASAPQSAELMQAGQDWTAYGGTNYGDRYSALHQINTGNVSKLKLAWEFETGDRKGADDPIEFTYEDTPLKVGHTVYVCTPHAILFALDAASGKQRWKFDPHIVRNPTFQHMTCRGVAYHETAAGATTSDGTPAPTECPRRIFLPTDDGRMFALNADDGSLCAAFGDHGAVDLKQWDAVKTPGFYEGTSPPVATDKVLIVGGSVIDNYSLHVPSGAIRALDIYSGRLLWVFDAGNHDPNEMPSPAHPLKEGTPPAWAPAVADEKLGLVYLPLGTTSPDIWGGNRAPDEERYDSSLIALEINTGKLRWFFQNVHHDLWDMDVPAQPSLFDLQTSNGVVPAIYVPAKTGNIFVLDRRDGHLIVPAPEKPVPQGPAAGDRLSPTQPFSELSLRPRESLTGAKMWGATMFDQLACRIMFHSLRYEGPFTPPSVQGTLVFPGDFGMFEWGGVSLDPQRQIAIVNPMSIPFVSKLIPRGPDNPPEPNSQHPPGSEWSVQPMYGVPFGVSLKALESPLGIPCLQPPWGNIAALDLKTNQIVWQHRIGTIRDMAPVPLPFTLGVPMLGAPLTTAGGVTFETGTMDDYVRAFDVTDGKLLWQDRLPAGGQSTPMSYEENGKQYILTVDGGHGSFGTKLGDYVRAYALPDNM